MKKSNIWELCFYSRKRCFSPKLLEIVKLVTYIQYALTSLSVCPTQNLEKSQWNQYLGGAFFSIQSCIYQYSILCILIKMFYELFKMNDVESGKGKGCTSTIHPHGPVLSILTYSFIYFHLNMKDIRIPLDLTFCLLSQPNHNLNLT